jgi:hypothetical protein
MVAIRHMSEASQDVRRMVRSLQTMAQESFVRELLSDERYADPRRLTTSEYQVYSQNGEDGAISEIFRRIGTLDRSFVEIGVGRGLENNTTCLLAQGWRGCWVEGGPDNVRYIRDHHKPYLDDGRLRLVELFVTRDNIASTLRSAKVPREFDLFSLDVDMNTYWIWEALAEFSPRAAVIEYNASYPPSIDWKVPYASDATWDWTFRFGASLKAYELLGRKLGYALVGCDLSGTNAYFVRDDLCGDQFLGPFTAENHYEPPRYWLARPKGHPRPAYPC